MRGHRKGISQFFVLREAHKLEVVDGEDLVLGVFSRVILQNDHLAGETYCKIRFSGDKEGESLGRRGGLELSLSVLVEDDLADVSGAAIRCNHPKDISQKFST